MCENISKFIIIKFLFRLYIECIVLWGIESGMKYWVIYVIIMIWKCLIIVFFFLVLLDNGFVSNWSLLME